ESVLARLAGNPHLPSPPGIVLQILDKASRLDCTPADLAVLIHCVVREGDMVSRYGGDEFCILVENTLPERIREGGRTMAFRNLAGGTRHPHVVPPCERGPLHER